MFILTNINIPNDVVQIFDTKDGSNEIIRLSVLAHQIVTKTVTVSGIGVLQQMKHPDALPISRLGIYVCTQEAKEAMAKYYIKNGVPEQQAYAYVGLR